MASRSQFQRSSENSSAVSRSASFPGTPTTHGSWLRLLTTIVTAICTPPVMNAAPQFRSRAISSSSALPGKSSLSMRKRMRKSQTKLMPTHMPKLGSESDRKMAPESRLASAMRCRPNETPAAGFPSWTSFHRSYLVRDWNTTPKTRNTPCPSAKKIMVLAMSSSHVVGWPDTAAAVMRDEAVKEQASTMPLARYFSPALGWSIRSTSWFESWLTRSSTRPMLIHASPW